MKLAFQKYHGTGNDFILIDNRKDLIQPTNTALIAKLCDRHFGIGADGVILLENSNEQDFYMRYYNADGNESSMCGNGGRCVVAFAKNLGIITDKTSFEAIDGLHNATIDKTTVTLQMSDVKEVKIYENHVFLDTGSPHHVSLVESVTDFPVKTEGRRIRHEAPYYTTGTNVNFVQQVSESTFKIRTYERGVEDETLSCGTGATAVAIAMYSQNKTKETTIKLETLGGDLKVSFVKTKSDYTKVFLKGKATFVFEGFIEI